MGQSRLRQQLDLFLHAPQVEISLLVLLLLWVLLVVVDLFWVQPGHPNFF